MVNSYFLVDNNPCDFLDNYNTSVVPGCGLNYHKRCAVKVPSNCTSPVAGGGGGGGASSRRVSAGGASTHSHASHDDSLVRRLAHLVTGNTKDSG